MNKKRNASGGVGTPKEAMLESESGFGKHTFHTQYSTSNGGCATTKCRGDEE